MRILLINARKDAAGTPDGDDSGAAVWDDLPALLSQRGHDVGFLHSTRREGRLTARQVGSDIAAQLVHRPTPDVVLQLTEGPIAGELGVFCRRMFRTPDGRRPRLALCLGRMDAPASGCWMDRLASRWRHARTTSAMRQADAILVPAEDMGRLLRQRYGPHACGQRVRAISPWDDGRVWFAVPKEQNPLASKFGLAEAFNVVHFGPLDSTHDLDTTLKAIELTATSSAIRWMFIGAGEQRAMFQELLPPAARPHVRLLDDLDPVDLNHALNLGDVHLVSQQAATLGSRFPRNLLKAMAAGRAVVYAGPAEADAALILQQHRAGLTADKSPEQLARHLWQLRDSAELRRTLGENARRAFSECYDRPVAAARFEQALCEHAL